jgi:hypothetical protein
VPPVQFNLWSGSPVTTSWGPGRLDMFGFGLSGMEVRHWAYQEGIGWGYEPTLGGDLTFQ